MKVNSLKQLYTPHHLSRILTLKRWGGGHWNPPNNVISEQILGFPRHLSQHTGGFVITKGPLDNIVPIENARMKGYVETFFGRRIPIKGINSKNFQERSFAERQSINAPIQGSAADIIKRAMIKIYNVFQEKNIETKMLLQVHDELVFECPKDEINTASNLIRKEMEQANLPLFPLNICLLYTSDAADE